MVVVLLFAAASFGQAELENYVGQYQVTGAPIMITVTVTGGKLAIEATGQVNADIELVSGEDYAVKGTAITLTCQNARCPLIEISQVMLPPCAKSEVLPHNQAFQK